MYQHVCPLCGSSIESPQRTIVTTCSNGHDPIPYSFVEDLSNPSVETIDALQAKIAAAIAELES